MRLLEAASADLRAAFEHYLVVANSKFAVIAVGRIIGRGGGDQPIRLINVTPCGKFSSRTFTM